MRHWTPEHSELARSLGGLLPRTTKVGGWIFRRHRDAEPEPVPIWDGNLESCPIVPKPERITQPSLREIEWDDIDQEQTSACAVGSFANAMSMLMAKLGRAKTPLDWYKVYLELTGGRGGVEIGTVLAYAMTKGFPTKDGKSRVVVTEAWDADGREAIVSGLQKGAVATFGHDVHAEAAITEVVEANGTELLDTRNTWGKSFGEQGWHKFPLADVEMQYGAAIIRDLDLRPIDVEGLPDAEE